MAATAVDANDGGNASDIQEASLLDPSDANILDELRIEEELYRIRCMPVPMAQKKLFKSLLPVTLLKHQLKGWSNIKWTLKKFWKNLTEAIARQQRSWVFLNNSLRTIEVRSGTAIVNVFLFIKWTIFMNLGISLVLITFIIGPYLTYTSIAGGSKLSPSDAATCGSTDEGHDSTQLADPKVKSKLLDCCAAKYDALLGDASGKRGVLNFLIRSAGLGNFEAWPVSYSYYNEPVIRYSEYDISYQFNVAYILTGCGIFGACLLILVKSIANGVREIILLREGEFYKYSILVFSGWEHYTNDAKGAEFKRRALGNEMKIALHTEIKKVTDLLITKRQKAKIYIMRVFVNVIVLGLIISAGAVIFYTTLELTNEGRREIKTVDLIQGFVPSFAISFFNLIFPIILAKLGKLENYSREWETALILLRSLFIRMFSVYAAAVVFYRFTYCAPQPGYCTKCQQEVQRRRGTEVVTDRVFCWESLFADQIYRLILADLTIKVVLTFIMEPIRRLIGHVCKNRVGKRISHLSFNIVRHSLDVIYIQILSWMSFYFAPFAPIVAVIYCIIVFYTKKFSVLHNCSHVPDTFKTTRSTGMFMVAKVISFVVVLFTFAFIVGFMVPSLECGPFRGKLSAWDAVRTELYANYPNIYGILEKLGSPGIALPISLGLILAIYYYFSVAQANRAMVEQLRHLLILEGHDKQYLFSKLNSLRRSKKRERKTFKSPRLRNKSTGKFRTRHLSTSQKQKSFTFR